MCIVTRKIQYKLVYKDIYIVYINHIKCDK